MTITTKIISEICRLNREEKLNDAEISEALSIKYGTVRYYRIKEGLPNRRHKYRDSLYKRYCVYDVHTSEFLLEGTATECAARLDIKIGYFYMIVTKTKRGTARRYEIYAVGKEHTPQNAGQPAADTEISNINQTEAIL